MESVINAHSISQDSILMSKFDLSNLIDQVVTKTATKVANNISSEMRALQEDTLLSQEEALKLFGVKNKSSLWSRTWIPKTSNGKYSRRILERAKYLI